LQSQREIESPPAPQTTFLTRELGDTISPQPFALSRIDESVCYRQPAQMQHGAHEHHSVGMAHAAPAPICLDTQSLQPVADADMRIAEKLARHYSQGEHAIKSAEMITKFSGEYGFINKRLPVWRIQFENDATRWYVETASGTLALRADDSDAREGWVFSIFHKARFIGDAYKNARDGCLMMSALLMLILSALGMWLHLSRFRLS
jgi:hypothetical protein